MCDMTPSMPKPPPPPAPTSVAKLAPNPMQIAPAAGLGDASAGLADTGLSSLQIKRSQAPNANGLGGLSGG